MEKKIFYRMELYAVITGDIENFTALPDHRRSRFIAESEQLMSNMVKKNQNAQMFRGDSYQLLFDDIYQALEKAVQLICWFKLNSDKDSNILLSTRLSIGIGEIAYEGKSVLDSDGEAFHLSGRNFDLMNKEEIIRLTTSDDKKNETYSIVLLFMNAIIKQWTPSQAETIFELLSNKENTQEKIAKKLHISQPAIAYSLRAAKWREIERGIYFINKELAIQYLREWN